MCVNRYCMAEDNEALGSKCCPVRSCHLCILQMASSRAQVLPDCLVRLSYPGALLPDHLGMQEVQVAAPPRSTQQAFLGNERRVPPNIGIVNPVAMVWGSQHLGGGDHKCLWLRSALQVGLVHCQPAQCSVTKTMLLFVTH